MKSARFGVIVYCVLLSACPVKEEQLTPDQLAPEQSALSPGEWLPGGDTTNRLLFGGNAFIPPASNILPEHENAFYAGNSFFNQAWVEAPASTAARDGLGPLFNARSCAACHFKDGRGQPPLSTDENFVGLLLRLSIPGEDAFGGPLPDPHYGGQLQPFAIQGVPAEGRPTVTYEPVAGKYEDGTPYTLLRPTYHIERLAYGPLHEEIRISPRVAPAVIGLGLLEAIPLARLEALADPKDKNKDGISGRIAWRPDSQGGQVVGRFGWKAEQPTVRSQSAGAFLGDIGVTSSGLLTQECSASQEACLNAYAQEEPEIDDAMLDRVALYGRLLAVPARLDADDPIVLQGKKLFKQIGCTACHVPAHLTGDVEDLPELAHQRIWPYTDLLLHDMGEDLSDHRPVFSADGSEWRTPPLWGLRFYRDVNDHERLLHDGRAQGVAEAILWHGGEGMQAKEGFRALSQTERAAVVRFVESL